MENSKKSTVGGVKVPTQLNGENRIINSDLNANRAVYSLQERIILSKLITSLVGLKNGFYIGKLLPI